MLLPKVARLLHLLHRRTDELISPRAHHPIIRTRLSALLDDQVFMVGAHLSVVRLLHEGSEGWMSLCLVQ